MTVRAYGEDRGEFEVEVPGEKLNVGGHRSFKYTIFIMQGSQPTDEQLPFTGATCTCLKTQLTGIPCSHLIAVCMYMRFDISTFVDRRYSTGHMVKTWSGQFHSYGDEDTWPVARNRPKIIPDKSKINRGRRKGIRIPMTMDEMERKNAKRRQAKKKNKTSTSQTTRPEEPLPMAALQSCRRTSRPPSRTGTPIRRANVQPGRHSLNVDPSSMLNPTETFVQPRRASVSVDPRRINSASVGVRTESARFPSRSTSTTQGTGRGSGEGSGRSSGEVRGKGIAGRIRGLFSKGRKKN